MFLKLTENGLDAVHVTVVYHEDFDEFLKYKRMG